MTNTIYDQYLENDILNASPVKLVRVLYRAAIDSVGAARLHLHKGAIRERSRSITRASEILNHLMLTLDRSAGDSVSRNLVELYAYMVNRLAEANLNQSEPPLMEVERLLQTLLEAWDGAENAFEQPGHTAVADPDRTAAAYSHEGVSY